MNLSWKVTKQTIENLYNYLKCITGQVSLREITSPSIILPYWKSLLIQGSLLSNVQALDIKNKELKEELEKSAKAKKEEREMDRTLDIFTSL